MTTETKNCKVLIEWREGATLQGRWTDLEEVRRWNGDAGPDTCLTFIVASGNNRDSQEAIWSNDPQHGRILWLPDDSWVECQSLPEAISLVDRLLSGESAADIFASV